MNRKELRHDRHTVSFLTDHMVFAPKYRGKILIGDVAKNICGHRAVSMEALEMAGTLWVNTLKHRIHIMTKTLATGLVLKSGVCDF